MINATCEGMTIVCILLTVIYLMSAISPGFVAITYGILLAFGVYFSTYF